MKLRMLVKTASVAVGVLIAGVGLVDASPYVHTQIPDSPMHGNYGGTGYRGTFTGDASNTHASAGNNKYGNLYSFASGTWTSQFNHADAQDSSATQADGLSDAGHVVGTVYNGFGPGGGYVSTDSGATPNWKFFFGAEIASINDVNIAGTIIGTSETTTGVHTQTAGGVTTTLAAPFGAATWAAYTIADDGDIGGSYESGGVTYGFIRDGTTGVDTSIDVPASIHLGLATGYTRVTDTNGDIVVGEWKEGGVRHSWALQDGVFTSLDVPSGWTNYLNSSGGTSAGGAAAKETRNPHVANNGVVVGYWLDGRHGGGLPSSDPGAAHLWSVTIPEPGTIALLGLGAMAVICRRRRA